MAFASLGGLRLSFSRRTYCSPQKRWRASSATQASTKAPHVTVLPGIIPDAVETKQEDGEKPGLLDSNYFPESPSVGFWRSFEPDTAQLSSVIAASVRRNPADLAYWIYCIGRTTFFALQGAASLLSAVRGGDAKPDRAKFLTSKSAFNLVAEAVHVYEQDLERVRAGVYKMPWDVMDVRHRQMDPRFVARSFLNFAGDSSGVLRRRDYAPEDGKGVWMDGPAYPDYYKNAFHYQTDGWFSSKSAEVYDAQTETLFVGRQDAMQRLALCALSDFLRDRDELGKAKIVEIAAGTGRFATFARDSFPDHDYIVSDLSPFYLEKAREHMQYWESHTAAKQKHNSLGSVEFLQCNAEALPLDDSSVDFIHCIYLFHELPPESRAQVVAEAARVLRKGGVFVITDSYQLGDRGAAFDARIDNFEQMNEPWYSSYVRENLGELVTKSGEFTGLRKEVSSVTKMLSFKRR